MAVVTRNLMHRSQCAIEREAEQYNVSVLVVWQDGTISLRGPKVSRYRRCLPVSQEINNSVPKVAEGPVQIPHLHH